ncbi:protocatechuate 3,4-dioxygenase subunit alpha [Arthrobacter sp. MYb229]|uniref:protocatechuate 3,4-dioxygenase subunit alpha n=1 Tax=unclassified Arthrobacter TaxID=235627 RepID=UPI000CFB4D8A|nr:MULTISPECIES: protocatechuate 3,4-dioxygenase subunit alpha [unclassified Arthrobacter]PRA03019.1 protocatechuate 3,4-dioxygenase subunit alpha [Arthrobacter sp. MYb229]PRB49489.1 protocatechuate 3,4-dioxygenase subunit alpha [Arthrobacter sp. MYb216]
MPQAANTQAPALKLAPTPGQTIGPFYGYAMPFDKDNELVNQANPNSVRLHGVITDGKGEAIPDALLEIWQADEHGIVVSKDGSLVRDGYTFTGWGRTAVDNVGHYTFTTLNPGATEAGKAPFIMLTVFARGLLNRLFTRIYLPEDTAALASDPLLAALDDEQRRTLIATREEDGSLRFDIRLQGDLETVFLSYPRGS